MIQSKLFSLVSKDWLNGLYMTVSGAILTAVLESLNAGQFTFNYKHILGVGLIAGITYIQKKFVSNSKGEILTGEPTR